MGAQQSRMLFVNLAVADLRRAVDFFTELGFTFDERMTDENATCMIVSDQAFVMLLTRERFRDFTKREIVNSSAQTEAILAVSAESREDVDAFADKALGSGGETANEPLDYGWMYGRSFHDPDGHLWEIVWMDPARLEE